jgi:hypothetical protein
MAAPGKVVPLLNLCAVRVHGQVLPLQTARATLDAAGEQRRRGGWRMELRMFSGSVSGGGMSPVIFDTTRERGLGRVGRVGLGLLVRWIGKVRMARIGSMGTIREEAIPAT